MFEKIPEALINISARTYFTSLCGEYISIPLPRNHDFIDPSFCLSKEKPKHIY